MGERVPAMDLGRFTDVPPLLASPMNTIGEFSDDKTTGRLAGLTNPPPDTTLLITATEWSTKHEAVWTKNVDAGGIQVVFNAPRPNEWTQWVGARLTSRGVKARLKMLFTRLKFHPRK